MLGLQFSHMGTQARAYVQARTARVAWNHAGSDVKIYYLWQVQLFSGFLFYFFSTSKV